MVRQAHHPFSEPVEVPYSCPIGRCACRSTRPYAAKTTHFTNHAHNEMPLATVRDRSPCSTLSPKEGVSHTTMPLTHLHPIFPCPWSVCYGKICLVLSIPSPIRSLSLPTSDFLPSLLIDPCPLRSLSLSKRPISPKPGWFDKLTTQSLPPVEAPDPAETPTQMVRQAHHPVTEPVEVTAPTKALDSTLFQDPLLEERILQLIVVRIDSIAVFLKTLQSAVHSARPMLAIH